MDPAALSDDPRSQVALDVSWPTIRVVGLFELPPWIAHRQQALVLRTVGKVTELARRLQEVTDHSVEVAFVNQGDTGQSAVEAAQAEEIALEVVRRAEAKKGFLLLPCRWAVERTFAWLGRFCRLARDYERLTTTLAGYPGSPFSESSSPELLRKMHSRP